MMRVFTGSVDARRESTGAFIEAPRCLGLQVRGALPDCGGLLGRE